MDSPILDNIAIESIQREIEASGVESLKKPVAFLALSGGGENGAFGAGSFVRMDCKRVIGRHSSSLPV